MHNIRDVHALFRQELQALYDQQEIRSFVFLLLEEYCGLSKTKALAEPEFAPAGREISLLQAALHDLKNHKPIQHIVGYAEFAGLKLHVSPGVLIPRPETEELVEWILSEHREAKKNIRILDMGTGSGCIAVALAKSLHNAECYAADVSETALKIASANAAKHHCNIHFVRSDMCAEDELLKCGHFHVIVSNPPYIRESEKNFMKRNVLDYEPGQALFVPDDDPLVFYRCIFRFAAARLLAEGTLYLEVNELLGQETLGLATEMGFGKTELRKDLSGKERMLKCQFR